MYPPSFWNACRSFGHIDFQRTAPSISRSACLRWCTYFTTNFEILHSKVFPWTSQKGKNVVPLPFVNWDKIPLCLMISRAVSRHLYDALIHDFPESKLDQKNVTLSRSGLSLCIWQVRMWIRLLLLTKPVYQFRINQKRHVVLTGRTAPILVCPQIHALISESGSSRGNVYFLHALVLPSEPSSTSWTVLWYIPMETLLMNPADSQAFVIQVLFDKSSNLCWWIRRRSPAAWSFLLGLYQKSTTCGSNIGVYWSFALVTDFSMLRCVWPGISWVNSSHQLATAP